jgi:hypothetical protein
MTNVREAPVTFEEEGECVAFRPQQQSNSLAEVHPQSTPFAPPMRMGKSALLGVYCLVAFEK